MADIEKCTEKSMYIDCSSLPKILQREDQNEPVKVYKLNTVTYGTACAPFLAVRTLHQLAQDEVDE